MTFLNPAGQKITDGSYTGEEGFIDTPDGARVYGLTLHSTAYDLRSKDWTLKGGEVYDMPADKNAEGDAAKGGKVYVVGSTDAVLVNEKQKTVVKINWTPTARGLLYDRCQSEILSAKTDAQKTDSKLPFPVGVSCNLETTPARITVSVPGNIEWDQHSFEELAGKGERWRMLVLPSATTTNDQVGTVAFREKQKLYKISLHVRTLTKNAGPGRSLGFEKSVAFGRVSSGLTAAGTTYNSSDFVFRFQGLTEHLLKVIKLGLFLKFNLGTSSDPNLIFSKDVGLSAGYFLPDADGEAHHFSGGLFGEFHSLDYKHDVTNFSLQASFVSLGALAEYQMNPGNRLRGWFRYGNFMSSLVTANTNIQVGYQHAVRLINGANAWVGIGYSNQSMTAKNLTGDSRTLPESQYLLTLDF